MKKKKLSPKAQEALAQVIERFQDGDLGPLVVVARIQVPEDSPAANWSLGNRTLAYIQTGELDCRTFKQWKDVGRWPKPAQERNGNGIAYLWRPIHKTIVDEETEEERRILIDFWPFHVFAYSATDGDEHAFTYEIKEMPPLYEVAKAMGLGVKWGPQLRSLGSYNLRDREIGMGANDVQTFFHELAHAVRHRLDPEMQGGQDSEEETIADFTGCVLAAMYGADYSRNCWDYISQYNDDPLKAISEAISSVEGVIALIEEIAKDNGLH
jgi:hypothetical protein